MLHLKTGLIECYSGKVLADGNGRQSKAQSQMNDEPDTKPHHPAGHSLCHWSSIQQHLHNKVLLLHKIPRFGLFWMLQWNEVIILFEKLKQIPLWNISILSHHMIIFEFCICSFWDDYFNNEARMRRGEEEFTTFFKKKLHFHSEGIGSANSHYIFWLSNEL